MRFLIDYSSITDQPVMRILMSLRIEIVKFQNLKIWLAHVAQQADFIRPGHIYSYQYVYNMYLQQGFVDLSWVRRTRITRYAKPCLYVP